MKSEEIIMLIFVSVIVLGVPVVMWLFHRDKKRQEMEEESEWQKHLREKARIFEEERNKQ